jgi:cyclopropane fatty-acyl-phospholipid synthase-like methyltransferase
MAEIGCGIGHIVRNIRCEKKTGYDIDEHVLNAAKFLSLWRIRENFEFKIFEFPLDNLEGTYDLIVMVNWIHEVNPDVLRQNFEKYFRNNLNRDGTVILDTVQDKNYTHNHNIDFLTKNISCTVYEIGNDVAQRKVYAIRNTI